MKTNFPGGANEIGASSTLIEIDEYRILVDAGIRMGPGQDSPLPDFPDFDKVGMPAAVLLTHAHADHTGALPVLRNLWLEGVKIYWTPATKAITRVMLEDSVNRMKHEEQEEGKQPLYTRDDVDVFWHCKEEEVPWLEPVPICEGVTATWIPAGHILGAAMIYIQGKSESILMTGDVSATNQLTIPGMVVPEWVKPDVMVIESTYGHRQHERTRKQEARRLAEDVAQTIEKGGKVLIPAFAVGRAQEAILILKHAMESEEIPPFPVYVDGMVRDINRIYSDPDFADELSPSLQRKAERGENLFYSDVIEEVARSQKPEGILAGKPCCIVASSGMLIGGKSSEYAKHLAGDPKNLIAITGYQAEGNPGRALWDWVEAGRQPDRIWHLKDQVTVRVECQVKKYSLSAHADSEELLTLVGKMQPRKLFLVHGDADARGELFKSVHKAFLSIDVQLPQNGEVYSIEKRIGIACGSRHTMERVLSELHACLLEMRKKGPFHTRELAEFWFGSEAITEIVVKFVEWCLSLDREFFRRGSNNLFYLR
ncbi:MAG: MBL fold metallo-hydrolase [Candidatus Poribacteria bacterium]|nr:MBL fold metallo-hydrolase [Candidatus Poribacteria bacterium]